MSGNLVTPNSLRSAPTEQKIAAEEISTYFLDLDRLLERIERSSSHYQALGVERTAALEQIASAYQEATGLLYPAYRIGASLPAAMASRIEDAFKKASGAFAVLASFSRRKSYDSTLLGAGNRTAALALPQADALRAPHSNSAVGVEAEGHQEQVSDKLQVHHRTALQSAYSEFAGTRLNDNRRRCERYALSLPVRVIGYDRQGDKWDEMAETVDVSRTGLQLRLRKRVSCGTVLYLTLPYPMKLRSHGFAAPSYNVYALVRRIGPPKNGARLLGMEFIGEHPPTGYLEKPWAAFRTHKWAGAERRRAARFERVELIRLEYLTEDMQALAVEATFTENLSRTGLRAIIKSAPPQFDFIRVSCPSYNFESLAIFCNRFVGKDGQERLSLRFLDKEWPL